MPLAPGASLGPFEILSALGAGGMGEVYKATDTRLGRAVAIKVSIVRTTGEATPVVLREHIYFVLPEWSPDGQWITFLDKDGWPLFLQTGKPCVILASPRP
jgi:serine/threonine protein kinase